MFDCLHDMGDPVGAARRSRDVARARRRASCSSSRWPATTSRTTCNPLGRVFYGASTLICTPARSAQPGSAALGTQAGPPGSRSVLRDAGFGRVRMAATTPVNLVLEARR